eukprot:5541573-Alexandrium_andersonii.AAC.1
MTLDAFYRACQGSAVGEVMPDMVEVGGELPEQPNVFSDGALSEPKNQQRALMGMGVVVHCAQGQARLNQQVAPFHLERKGGD